MVVGRCVDDNELDAMWAVMGADVFHLLTRIGGRSVDSYEQWLAEIVSRLLIDERPVKQRSG